VRAPDLPTLVDDHGLHTAPHAFGRTILLRPVPDPWPFPDGAVAVPRLVGALDLLELAAEGHPVDVSQVWATWELLEQHATQAVPSWYRATRPPRAGPASSVAVLAPKRPLRAPSAAPATDADLRAAMLFAVGQPVRRADLLTASGWTPARLQAAVDLLLAEPPRGQQVLVDDDRLQLVTAPTVSSLVQGATQLACATSSGCISRSARPGASMTRLGRLPAPARRRARSGNLAGHGPHALVQSRATMGGGVSRA
jgi:hypothetical protein